MKLLRVFCAAAACSIGSTGLAQTAAMPDVNAFGVGDEWAWRQIDNFTKLESPSPGRTILIAEEQGVRKAVVDGTPRPLVYPYVFEPSPKPWRVWPLEVGKQWTTDVDFVPASGGSGNLKQDARVVAYEEVVVPAGKFMAFKIEYDGFVRSGNFNGRIVDTYWYAPAARADVKHVRRVGNTNFTRELIKYPALSGQPGMQAPSAATVPPASPTQTKSPSESAK